VPSIILYTRIGCPLCDKALEQLEPLARAHGVDIEIIDIDLDLDLLDRYNDRVPVIERPDGSVIDEGIVDVSLLSDGVKNLR
jgi:thiol-disulfide isomerase/thioredoxin